ncbi:MAG: ribonuclease P protein component, partial [Alphaproteobacteria bacterium]|nr:ribonuclease P protein component [Alphaproteobacteria bacterium]
NSVVRNRIRRRLRAAVAEEIAKSGTAGWDYVVIGRNTALDAPYEILLRDLRYALRKVAKSEPKQQDGEKR